MVTGIHSENLFPLQKWHFNYRLSDRKQQSCLVNDGIVVLEHDQGDFADDGMHGDQNKQIIKMPNFI
jgi:hypothetical protein